LKNSSIYNGNNSSGDSPSIKSPNSILKNGSSYNNNNNSNGNNNNSLLSINSPNAYIEDMALEDMDQAELNKYITNLSIRLKNSIKEVKEEKDKCDLLRQKEKNLERKLRIRDKELESLHIELDEKINSFNNAVKVLVVQLGMAQESKSKTQEELSSVEYRTMELAKSLETISELMNGERKSTRNAEDKYHNFVAEYEEEINLLQGEKSQIIHEKESLKQQNANLQAKINKLVKTLKKFQVNLIESEKRNYYESAANLSNLKNENDLLKRKLDEINKTKSYIENRYHQLQADYERQQAVTNPNVNNSYYDQEDDQSHLAQQAKEYKKELEKVKVQLRETEEAHQTEIYKLLDRLALAEGKAGKKRESSSSYKRNSSSNYIAELEKKLEKSYSIQKELKEKLKKSETLMNKKLLENKELEGRCLSYKKSLTTLQDTVSTYENHQTKLLNTNYSLSSQLNNGKKGKFINTRSYSGFRTIMNDIKKMTVTELQDEVVELRQEVESMNKKNWDLKLEVDRYQSANESNRRTIMVLMKRINDERNNDKKEEDTMVEGERSTTFTKDTSNIRNSSSSMNSRHESNATLLNSEAFDDEYSSKTSINKLPVLSEVDNEILIHEGSEEEETANVSPFLVNKSNSSSSSTAVNLPIHALPNDDGFKDTTETHSLSQPSSSSDFSMIKVNDEVCIRESTISTDSIKYSSYHDY
jgi:chromosome segregation ATPase